MISRYVYCTCILNTKLHGKRFVRYLSATLFCISWISQQLVRKYRTRILSIYYSKCIFPLVNLALCGLVLFFKRCFLFSFTSSQHFITR